VAGAKALERGLAVLMAVRDSSGPLSVVDVARITGLERSVVAALLRPLIDEGFLEQGKKSRSIVLGPAMQHWSGADAVRHAAEETGDAHFAAASIDAAYIALLSFAGGLPLSTIAGLAADEEPTGALGAMMSKVMLDDLGPDTEHILGGLKHIDPVAIFIDFFDGLPGRDQRILWERLASHPRTLEGVASRSGLSRDRVRRIVNRLRSDFEALVSADAMSTQRSAMARKAIGGLVDIEDVATVLHRVLPMSAHLAPDLLELFFFLLFPAGTFFRYQERSPLHVTAEARQVLEEVHGRALTEGLSLEEFTGTVSALGWIEDMDVFLSSIGLSVLDGQVLAKNISRNDRAVLLLRKEGAPLPFDSIVEALGEERARSLRNGLLTDERIVRVDRDVFALAEWGLPIYTSVRDLVRQEVERAGGQARIADIKASLSARFSITPAMVVAQSRSPEFAMVAPGVIRMRVEGEAFDDVEMPLESLRDCVRIGRRWALRVEVGSALLKGHSVTLPPGLGRHFGVPKGRNARLVTDRSGTISLGRNGITDTVGRLRWVAEELGLSEGAVLFILLPERSGGRISFSGVARRTLDGARPARRAGLLLGMQDDLTLAAARGALGLTRGSRPADVVDRLRSRGEDGLAVLVGEVLGVDGEVDAVATVDAKDIGRMLGL
jgi:predicted transcriptional regulator